MPNTNKGTVTLQFDKSCEKDMQVLQYLKNKKRDMSNFVTNLVYEYLQQHSDVTTKVATLDTSELKQLIKKIVKEELEEIKEPNESQETKESKENNITSLVQRKSLERTENKIEDDDYMQNVKNALNSFSFL